MPAESIVQIEMDTKLKEEVEELYRSMGTSFAEAVRIFAAQSVMLRAMPFTMHMLPPKQKRTLGVANGKYNFSESIDDCNSEIAKMFGVSDT